MNVLRVTPTTSANVSWRDEVSYSHDLRSEGFEKLKEALKQAKSSNPSPEASQNEIKQQENG